ncbi:MAG: class I SAM-dependent methyltransferase [bacterium]
MSIKVDPDWWKTLFDEIYLLTDARSVCNGELTRRETDVICDLVPMEMHHRILDLCGGQGRHSMELSSRGFSGCTVLDYSQYLIDVGMETASQSGYEIEFLQGDARETGLPGDIFDHVLILGNSIGYLPDPDDDSRILMEACRVLKPGSWILVDVADGEQLRDNLSPNAWHEIDEDIVVCRIRQIEGGSVRAREIVVSKEQGLIRDQSYSIRYFEAETIKDMMTGAGFETVTVHRDFKPHDSEGDFGFMNRRMIVTAKKPEDE